MKMNTRIMSQKFSILFAVLTFAGVVSSTARSEDQEPKIKGSISAKGLSKSEFAKSSKLKPEAASKIASEKFPGKVTSVKLENENGYLVYAVNIAAVGKQTHEVIVDAGNGKVLAEMNEDEHED